MRIRRYTPHAVFSTVVALAAALSIGAAALIPLPTGVNDFNSPGFIARHSWEKYGPLLARPFRAELDEAERSARVARFFELNQQINEERRAASDPALSEEDLAQADDRLLQLLEERARIENSVERIIEERLTAVARDAGLTRRYGSDIVWPPVNIEFQDPPHVLVESPRAEIRIAHETLLDHNLTPERIRELEEEHERDGETSVLVVRIGGIAMYPAIIPNGASYHSLMRSVAHEWIHHYLFFTPLGRRYFESGELRTLNETAANLIGKELGDLLVERYPLPEDAEPAARSLAAPRSVDFVAEMRDLRHRVEALLDEDRVEDAERLMEEKRDFFADNGVFVRRINQAYFAFHGFYADGAGSIDPIGPKMQDLRERSGSLADFVERARGLTSEADLDDALVTAR